MRRIALALVLFVSSLPAMAVEWIGALPDADRQAIEAAAVDADARWNARDADGMAALYTGDATLVVGGAPALHGNGAVQDYFTRSFARTPVALRHTTTVDRVVVLAPGLVLADTSVALDQAGPDGIPQRVRDFTTLTLLAKREGRWSLHAVRAVPVSRKANGAAD